LIVLQPSEDLRRDPEELPTGISEEQYVSISGILGRNEIEI
jgi:hypothetical protein